MRPPASGDRMGPFSARQIRCRSSRRRIWSTRTFLRSPEGSVAPLGATGDLPGQLGVGARDRSIDVGVSRLRARRRARPEPSTAAKRDRRWTPLPRGRAHTTQLDQLSHSHQQRQQPIRRTHPGCPAPRDERVGSQRLVRWPKATSDVGTAYDEIVQNLIRTSPIRSARSGRTVYTHGRPSPPYCQRRRRSTMGPSGCADVLLPIGITHSFLRRARSQRRRERQRQDGDRLPLHGPQRQRVSHFRRAATAKP